MERALRKKDHVNEALRTGQSGHHGLHDVRFVHNSLPNVDVTDVKIDTSIGELKLGSPFFINAMTGGGGAFTHAINEKLATIAQEAGVPLAVGSQMSAIKDPTEAWSYTVVRKTNPNGIIFANLGAEATVEQAKRAVAMIEADALQIHLNVVQELSMPEGDRTFQGAQDRIARIAQALDVPVIVKEVGYGMSRETVQKLAQTGVTAIDVGGYGGTNFARIENARNTNPVFAFNGWGISTAASLFEAKSANTEVEIVASGGVRNSEEIIKCLALGSSAVGLAGAVLRHAEDQGIEATVQWMETMKRDIRFMMTALGVTNIEQLQTVPLIVTGETASWCEARQIVTRR
ncbi:MAG: type 2 isopentenyl-diphosphate Delta-isomerase [Bacilli bacterium]